jgi:SOUL heme-binding protein
MERYDDYMCGFLFFLHESPHFRQQSRITTALFLHLYYYLQYGLWVQIDPLLTPTGRRVQEGTQTVARQLVQDILPNIFSLSPPKPQDIFNTNQRILQSVTTQMQQTLESMASDLADPMARIPARIRHQTAAVASTVLTDTPVDLTEPTYRVVSRYGVGSKDEYYEVREYDEYDVASTTIEDSVAVAYQRLAAYISGANAEHRVVYDVPVSMRTGNVLRFYVPSPLPRPLNEDAGVHRLVDGAHKIRIETIPAATLAVRRFTGFCTEGEIQRQKELLLNILNREDSVELDVPHGQTVGHLVLEYNPPVAVPMMRRNEIAIPVFTNNSSNA